MRLWVFKRHFSTIFQLYIDLWATLPGANMVQGRNTLGYLRTRIFYIPERKYAYKYASITKCLTCSPRNVKKIFKYPLSRPTTMSDQIIGLRECWLSNLSNILGGICPTWEYDCWYTWSVLYIVRTSYIFWSVDHDTWCVIDQHTELVGAVIVVIIL
jgi:hypothetical protein